jgi:hypothetical protein
MRPNNNVSWFYLREERNSRVLSHMGMRIYEQHRIGCIAMEKIGNGNIRVSFSLAAKGDQFVAKVARDIALGKLKSRVRSVDMPTPGNVYELCGNIPGFNLALNRNYDGALDSQKNEDAYLGALKEFNTAARSQA